MKSKKQGAKGDSPSVFPQKSVPETAFDAVNNYGTYNIQPTADTENTYPTIAQGYHPAILKSDGENRKAEKK